MISDKAIKLKLLDLKKEIECEEWTARAYVLREWRFWLKEQLKVKKK